MYRLIALAAVLAVSASLASAAVQKTEAYDNATVEAGGPTTKPYFFNIEGINKGSYAAFGIARFDTSAIRDAFDSQYGTGNWKIDGVELLLYQANAYFTTNGGVKVMLSDDDNTPFGSMSYPNGVGNESELTTYSFTEFSNGYEEVHDITDATLAGEIVAGQIVTLLLRETDGDVAATYAGFNSYSAEGPTLSVSASEIPEPATMSLLILGAAFAARRRRHR